MDVELEPPALDLLLIGLRRIDADMHQADVEQVDPEDRLLAVRRQELDRAGLQRRRVLGARAVLGPEVVLVPLEQLVGVLERDQNGEMITRPLPERMPPVMTGLVNAPVYDEPPPPPPPPQFPIEVPPPP